MARLHNKYYPLNNGVAELNVSSAPLSIAEIRAMNKKPVYKNQKIDYNDINYLLIAPNELVVPAGSIISRKSQEDADQKATDLINYSIDNFLVLSRKPYYPFEPAIYDVKLREDGKLQVGVPDLTNNYVFEKYKIRITQVQLARDFTLTEILATNYSFEENGYYYVTWDEPTYNLSGLKIFCSIITSDGRQGPETSFVYADTKLPKNTHVSWQAGGTLVVTWTQSPQINPALYGTIVYIKEISDDSVLYERMIEAKTPGETYINTIVSLNTLVSNGTLQPSTEYRAEYVNYYTNNMLSETTSTTFTTP